MNASEGACNCSEKDSENEGILEYQRVESVDLRGGDHEGS